MSGADPAITNTTVDDNFVKFQKFMKEFSREYRNMEELQLRYQIFCDNVKKIDEMNNTPGQTATFGINHFADQTAHEKSRMFGVRAPKSS